MSQVYHDFCLLCLALVAVHAADARTLPHGETQWKTIERQWSQMRPLSDRVSKCGQVNRPFTVNVEGIVGTGKSTFLEFFNNATEYPGVVTFPEPVDKWTNLNGTDILGLMYNDPERWAMLHEAYVLNTMLEEHLKTEGVAKVMERSLWSCRAVFIEYLRQVAGALKDVEYAILDQWFDMLRQESSFDTTTDLTVYLRNDPDVVMERIAKRGRKEEKGMTREFLQGIHRLHEDWLIHRNSSVPLPTERIIVVDTRIPLEDLEDTYKKLARKIWEGIPTKSRQRITFQ